MLYFREFIEQTSQGIHIGLKYDEQTTSALWNWINYCARENEENILPNNVRNFTPINKDQIHTTLVQSNSPIKDFSSFKPLGPIRISIPIANPRIKILGERGRSLVLAFASEWIVNRAGEIAQQLNLSIRKPIPHITVSYRSGGSTNWQWLNKLPIKSLTTSEEYASPFIQNWPSNS